MKLCSASLNPFLKLELHVELHSAGGLGRHSASEKRRSNHSNVGCVVDVIEDVERIKGYAESFGVIGYFREQEVVREIQIQIDQAGAMHGVSAHVRRPVVYNAITVVVAASRHIDGKAGVDRQSHSASKEPCWLRGSQQIKLVASIHVGASPI